MFVKDIYHLDFFRSLQVVGFEHLPTPWVQIGVGPAVFKQISKIMCTQFYGGTNYYWSKIWKKST